MQSQHAMMPLAASVNSMGEVSTNGEAMQQQHTQHMHQMAYNASATQAMAGHASLEQQQQQQHIQPAGTGFQQVAGPGSGLTHMQGSSMQPMDANTSMQHDGVSVAALSMPGPPAGHQPATAFPYTGESMQPAPPQPQQQQQQQQAVNASTFVYDPSQSQPSSSSSLAPQLSFAHTSQPPHFQQQLTGVTQQQQPGSSSNSNTPQQASNPFAVHHQHDPSSAPPTTTTSPRSSPTMSTSNLDTPTVGSSMSGPFAFPTGTPTSSTSNSSLNAPAGSVASTNSAPATSAGSGPFANVSAPAVKSRTATTISNGSSTSNTNNGQSSTLGNGIINTASTTSAPARASAGTGAEVVQQPSQQQQQQQTMQQNMQSQHQHQQEPSSLLSSAAVDSLPSSTPADAQPSASGLTLGQMDPQFALRQQLQQMPAQNQSQPLSATQPLMVHEQLSSAQGQELAVKACADLSNSYNKIADVLRQYTSVDMATRIRMRQDFCNSVSALDRAFFLSPAGPGYIGMNQDDNPLTRKRAYTVNSADGDDSNKHRRTISVTSDGRSDMSNGNHRSPHSIAAQAMRPPLGSHTHSSPLLPAESHYRATSAGVDAIPGPKASDMAVSGSHLVGRPTIPTQLYQSVLASDGMLTDGMAAQMPQDGIAPSQIQTQPTQMTASILSPMPIPAPNVQLDLAGMHPSAGQMVYQDNMQQSFAGEGVDPSNMQIQPSTTPTPTQQQTYVTPPMDSMPHFASQSGGMQYIDADMSGHDTMQSGPQMPPAPAATPTSTALSHSGGSNRSRPATRAGHPGSLDFTTLRPKEDETATSPYASSHLSMSSFPFSNSATGQTSGSRSRATSISRNTSASRSRAASINQSQHSLTHGPDAQELQNILGSLNAMPSPINEDDDDEDQSTADGNASLAKREVLSPELLASYNRVFLQWLPRICSDVEATDRKGEKIHQPLMAKKMAKLDEEHAFRPFKFRIQPFTNSFQDACKDLGLSESDTAPKLIKHFLWNQPLISRFNDEGKKTKSRGNHVWSIEARYLAPGHYEFRPPAPKIVPLPATAAPKVAWSWTPKVLDSSCQGPPMSASFSCGHLPPWLEFKDNVLQGTPPPDANSVMLDIAAEYLGHKLIQTFTIAVVAEDGVRPVANTSPAREEQLNGMQPIYSQTPINPGKGHHGNYSGSSLSSDLTHSTNSIMTPPSVMNVQGNSALLPSPLPALGLDGHMPMVNGHAMGSKMMSNMVSGGTSAAPSPTSPHQAGPYGNQMAQPVPFYLPTHPTDVTTLASANHIKAKLVEATTIHHENMSALNPSHPPPDPAKVSVAVDAAINRQLAMSSSQPAMPTATEVFNATLEVSTRSQQMQQEQFTNAISAVTQSIQQHPQLSTQVTSQLANFSFTPSNTPGNASPETAFIGQQ